MIQNERHVVVCGAGFAGLSCVRELAKAGMRVTILDANMYSTFQPLLYQVATAGLNPGDVSYPIGDFVRKRRAVFRHGEVTGIDVAARQVKVADGRTFGYDYLVLATGVTASHFGIKGAAENTFALYTRRDAIVLRDRLMAGIERLTESPDDFHVTVVGGGATGVELAGTVSELRREVFRATFPDMDPARLNVRLVEMAPGLLMPYNPKLRAYTLAQLGKRSVDVMLGTAIAEVTPDHVVLTDGRSLPSQLTVWAAGVAAPDAVAGWGLPQGHQGRIEVGADLRVRGQDRIFAIGDIAVNPDDPVPQLAQPALQMGRFAAQQIIRLSHGQETTSFRYHDKGIMATIGRRSAVVELPYGPRFRGTIAWVAWLGLHLMYLLGNRNRVTTLINLAWRYLSWGHGGGVIVGDPPTGPGTYDDA